MKQLKLLDYIIIAVVIAVLLIGALAYLGKNKFSKSPVEATKKIAFQVMLKSVSLTDSKMPFKIGEESFITIRNVPYTKLQIIDVAYQAKKWCSLSIILSSRLLLLMIILCRISLTLLLL